MQVRNASRSRDDAGVLHHAATRRAAQNWQHVGQNHDCDYQPKEKQIPFHGPRAGWLGTMTAVRMTDLRKPAVHRFQSCAQIFKRASDENWSVTTAI
jgi:hypothetical protein